MGFTIGCASKSPNICIAIILNFIDLKYILKPFLLIIIKNKPYCFYLTSVNGDLAICSIYITLVLLDSIHGIVQFVLISLGLIFDDSNY